MSQQRIKLGTRARVQRIDDMSTDRLLALAKQRAPDPSVFDEYRATFWRVRASSNRVDFYETSMDPDTTLPNFVQKLKEGVSYQDSHTYLKNGWGQSIDGRLVETGETEPLLDGEPVVDVYGDFFTLSGVQLSGQNTDDFAAAIRAGVWRDVSVGFFADDIRCTICGQQSFEWWDPEGCHHLPGMTYEVEGDDGVVRQVRAVARIIDGELSEVSQVYDGASPAAAVVKAEQMAAEGRLAERDRAFIERRYQVRIATPDRIYALGGLPMIKTKEETSMSMSHERDAALDTTEETTVEMDATAETPEIGEDTIVEGVDLEASDADTTLDEVTDELLTTEEGQLDVLADERARLAPHGIRLGRNPVAAVRALGDAVIALREKIARLDAQAADGRAYREDLITETLLAGKRAYGASFREETYRSLLDGASLDAIKAMRDDFRSLGDAVFPGGRLTRDTEGEPGVPEDDASRKRKTDDPSAYKG